MTISNPQNRQAYAGDDSTIFFPVPFRFLDEDDLKLVLRVDSTGVDTVLAKTTDYTVSGEGDPGGGSVLLAVAPASGETLTIYSDPVLNQLVDYVDGGPLPAEPHEAALDRLTLIAKRSRDLVERSLRIPDGDSDLLTVLPSSVDRASKHLGFDAQGNVQLFTPTTPAEILMAATLVEIGYLSGVNSGIQAQLDAADTRSQIACGRLTLDEILFSPVMVQTFAGKTAVHFVPYQGNQISLWNGSRWVVKSFATLTQATTDNTKSPAAVAANKNYDVFVWDDGGTLRATRGPAWAGNNSRGSGAGTTELELHQGVYVNRWNITNGPLSRRGRYVGSIRSNGSLQIDWKIGGSGMNGVAGVLGVWNMNNRRRALAASKDTGGYTYTASTIRQARASAGNQVSVLFGLAEDQVQFAYDILLDMTANSGGKFEIGIGLNSTTAYLGNPTRVHNLVAAARNTSMSSVGGFFAGLGFHTIAALEKGDGSFAHTSTDGTLAVHTLM